MTTMAMGPLRWPLEGRAEQPTIRMMAGNKQAIYRQFAQPVRPLPRIETFRGVQLRMIDDLVDLLKQRRRRPPGTAAAPIPADPKKPNTLTGGAAAALDFD
ncbi:MAG: hypothetical protein J7485_01760 [Sphingobium sp.]|nr:hypothetical protein [Sphingobium sp.]